MQKMRYLFFLGAGLRLPLFLKPIDRAGLMAKDHHAARSRSKNCGPFSRKSSSDRRGCRDALVVWRGLLLDGHNRLAICNRHGIPYDTTEIELPDRESAKLWIEEN